MKEQIIQKHFLALQAMPGDNSFIDISKLTIANDYNPNSLAEIDSFTMSFNEEEIINSIKEANIVDNKYLDGKLVIADNQKHNPIQVITKDFYDDFDIELFLIENLMDKNTINTLINKFGSIVKNEILVENLKDAYSKHDIFKMQEIIFMQDYLDQRKLIVYLVELNNKKKLLKNNSLVRDKAA